MADSGNFDVTDTWQATKLDGVDITNGIFNITNNSTRKDDRQKIWFCRRSAPPPATQIYGDFYMVSEESSIRIPLDATEKLYNRCENSAAGTIDFGNIGIIREPTDLTDYTPVPSSETESGIIELATSTEAVTGTDEVRAMTPANTTAKMSSPGPIGDTTPGTIKGTTGTFEDVEISGPIIAQMRLKGDFGNFILEAGRGSTDNFGIYDDREHMKTTVVEIIGGIMSRPMHSSFMVYVSDTIEDATGTGPSETILFDTVDHDQGKSFNEANGQFQSRMQGVYRFDVSVAVSGTTTAATGISINIVTTDKTFRVFSTPDVPASGADTVYHNSGSVLVHMDKFQTAKVNVEVTGEAGNVVDILGLVSGSVTTKFSGYLVA